MISISKKTMYNFSTIKLNWLLQPYNLHHQLVKGITAIRNKSDDQLKNSLR